MKRVALDHLPTRTHGEELGLEVIAWLGSFGEKVRPQGKLRLFSLPRFQVTQLRRYMGSTDIALQSARSSHEVCKPSLLFDLFANLFRYF